MIVALLQDRQVASIIRQLISSCLNESVEIVEHQRNCRQLILGAELVLIHIDDENYAREIIVEQELSGTPLILLVPAGIRPKMEAFPIDNRPLYLPLPSLASISPFLDGLKAIRDTIGRKQSKNLVLHTQKHVLEQTTTKREVLLTLSEQLLLYEFLSRPNDLLTYNHLIRILGGKQRDNSSVRRLVKSIREKLAEVSDDGSEHTIQTVRGEGYRLIQ